MSADEEEVPDPIDPDLPEHLQAILRWRWIDLIDRMKIPPHRKAVAKAMARFGNPDGTNVFPGAKKVADIANCDEKTARGHIKALVKDGMLTIKRRGGGRGGDPHTYRLTRPTDITTLPLWLDPDFNRIPEAAGFVSLAEEHRSSAPTESRKHRAPTHSETPEYRAPTPSESEEHRASTPSETPVDNPAERETPGDRDRNTGNSAPKHRAPRHPTIFITPLKDQNPEWLLQVSTSLGEAITARSSRPLSPTPPAIAELVGPPVAEPWLPEPAPAPRIVTASAVLTPTPEAGDWFRARARRELRDEGHPDPSPEALADRAAAIAARTDPETRSA